MWLYIAIAYYTTILMVGYREVSILLPQAFCKKCTSQTERICGFLYFGGSCIHAHGYSHPKQMNSSTLWN